MLAGAAAALVLIGAGFGVGAAVSGHAPGTTGSGPVTALTAVTGCAQLEQASGTLEQVNGSSLVIKTASGGPVTVTTTAATRMNASGALVEDITDGAAVLVAGPSSGGTIAADFVVVGSGASLAALPGVAEVQGTVSDASSAGFTVVTSAGSRVPVTTSGHTDVTLFHARPGQLQAGGSTIAIGYAEAGRDAVGHRDLPAPVLAGRSARHGDGDGQGLLARLDQPRHHGARLRRLIRPAPPAVRHRLSRDYFGRTAPGFEPPAPVSDRPFAAAGSALVCESTRVT